MRRIVPLALVTMFLCLQEVDGRALENWPAERLMKEADVVVMATAVASKDCKDTFKDKHWQVDFLGVETTFKVDALLKGKVEGDKLTMLHFRLERGVRVDSGPILVTFQTKGREVPLKRGHLSLGRPSYLLFLKKRSDGRFEAVSGQIDPALAVREMHRPFLDVMGKDD